MLQQTLSAIPLDSLGPWLAMLGFGAYHGLNPGMGWLFALSVGLQQQSERAIWVSLLPIAAGHAATIGLVALLVMAGVRFISASLLQWITAIALLAFGAYKVFNYYRHPRWVGMKVGMRDLFVWSFLMATAHGAGLMVAPAMLVVMGFVAWIVYKKLGLAVLRQKWINFDLIWAVALLLVGGIALSLAL